MSKKCSKCGEVKAPEEFNLCGVKRVGLQAYCRDCQAEYNRARRGGAA